MRGLFANVNTSRIVLDSSARCFAFAFAFAFCFCFLPLFLLLLPVFALVPPSRININRSGQEYPLHPPR